MENIDLSDVEPIFLSNVIEFAYTGRYVITCRYPDKDAKETTMRLYGRRSKVTASFFSHLVCNETKTEPNCLRLVPACD